MEKITLLTHLLFILAIAFTLHQFYLATRRSKTILLALVIWVVTQSLIGLTGFYTVTDTLPPRLLLLVAPGLLIPLILLFTNKGQRFIDGLDLRHLTLIHATRIPVEMTLYSLYAAGLVPLIMTYEGLNYDILSGIAALVIYFAMFMRNKLNLKLLLAWNVMGLLLLLNIVTIAILSVKTPFQKLAFEQANVGVTYFPFLILPGLIVPLVLFSHVAAIRKLSVQISSSSEGSAGSKIKTPLTP